MVVKLYCDGGTRGNVICLYDKERESHSVKRRKGDLSNNELEYLALIYTLEYARREYKGEEILIHMDSLLVVNHLKGEWKCKSPNLMTLLDKVKKKMFDCVTVKWVPRRVNHAGNHLEKFY
jgi:ribonuclease HI